MPRFLLKTYGSTAYSEPNSCCLVLDLNLADYQRLSQLMTIMRAANEVGCFRMEYHWVELVHYEHDVIEAIQQANVGFDESEFDSGKLWQLGAQVPLDAFNPLATEDTFLYVEKWDKDVVHIWSSREDGGSRVETQGIYQHHLDELAHSYGWERPPCPTPLQPKYESAENSLAHSSTS